MSVMGIAKTSKLRSLCRLHDKNNIPYNINDLMKLSNRQMIRQIRKLGGMKKNPRWRAGDNQ